MPENPPQSADLARMDGMRQKMRGLDFAGARELSEELARSYEKSGNALGLAWCRYYQAEIAFELGAFSLAEKQSEECLRQFVALGELSGQAWALCNLQRAICLMGQPAASKADRKSTRLNSSHQIISYAVFCLKKKKHI